MRARYLSSIAIATALALAAPAAARPLEPWESGQSLPGAAPDHFAAREAPVAPRPIPPAISALLLTGTPSGTRPPGLASAPPPGFARPMQAAVIPIPPGLPMLLAALGGFLLIRRKV